MLLLYTTVRHNLIHPAMNNILSSPSSSSSILPLQNPNFQISLHHYYFNLKSHSPNILPFTFHRSFQPLHHCNFHFNVRCNYKLPRSNLPVGESPVSDTEEDDEEDDEEAAEEYEVDAEFSEAIEADSDDEVEAESDENVVVVEQSRFEEFKWQRIERIRNDVREYGDGILDVDELSSVYNFRIDKFQIMLFLGRCNQLLQAPQQLTLFVNIGFRLYSSDSEFEIKKITKIINDHPFPDQPVHHTLAQVIPSATISTSFVENILGRLFATHSNGLKAFEFFKFSLQFPQFTPTSDTFEKTLHILTRMRHFTKAWDLIDEIQKTHPSLISLKSMSIMLSRIAKFQSFDETLEAFEKLEDKLSDGKQFGTDEFNLLLRAFCTQRQMKEAKSVFNKLYSRFSPTTKTMNILLLGFKESGDVTSVELFYHEMIRRGFKPDNVTYNIRIDSYCKRGRFLDGLRLLEEMEQAKCFPTLKTITTLIHGAGIAQNTNKARQLFDEIPKRKLLPDSGAYNALMSAYIRSGDVKSATRLMDEMEENNLLHDDVTFHTMFSGLMNSNRIDGVLELYRKMIDRNFVPKTPTVVMLMKFFCKKRKFDEAFGFWNYLIESGYCPHSHATDVLLRSLCSQGRVEQAFGCSVQILEKGRHLSKNSFRVLEKYLTEINDEDKLRKLNEMIKKLHTTLPASKGHAVGISDPNQDRLSLI